MKVVNSAIRAISDRRRFSGQLFRFYRASKTKAEAVSDAAYARRNGWLARVVKVAYKGVYPWVVYIRKVGS